MKHLVAAAVSAGIIAIGGVVAAGPVEDLSPGQWYEVPNSNLRTVVPSPAPPGNPTAITNAWSGGAYDTKRDRLVVWGGGHGDYGGNELYAFDLNTLRWSRIWGPSPSIPPIGSPCSETYSDGNPASRHTYGGLAYLANIDRFWNSGGSLYCGSGGATGGTWTFDFSGLRWERRASFSGLAELEQVTAYDPVSGRVFFANTAAPLHEYDPVADRWTKRGDAAMSHDKTAVIDPKRRKFVAVGCNWCGEPTGQIFVYDLSQTGGLTMQKVMTTGATALTDARYPGLAYDPVSDRIVGWSGGQNVYSLNLDTLVWTQLTPSNSVTPTAAIPSGTHGRWRYVPSKNVFIGVNRIDDNVFIYKLAAGSGSEPTSPTTPAPPAADSTSPVVSMTAPADGAAVTGTVTVSAGATDNVGVVGVQFKLNGQNVSAEVTAAPYSITWNTTTATDGTYNLTAVARDAAGNQATSAARAVTVSNVAAPPSSPSSPSAPSAGLVNIPLKQWVALAAPPAFSMQGIPATNKHVTPAYHPPSGRIYFTGGDYSAGGPYDTSYRQETWSLSIAERFANPSSTAEGWRLEYPYCGPSGQVQPKHPDYVGWTWDSRRNLFYMVPGVMEATTGTNCPGETTDKATNPGFVSGRMMSFDPATKRWAVMGDVGPDSQDTWMSVYDPVTDALYRFGMTFKGSIYNVASRTWSSFGMPSISIWKDYLALDVEGRAIYAVDGYTGRLHRFNITTRAFQDLGVVPGGARGFANLTHVVWDSVNRVLYYTYYGASSFYVYRPGTGTWETISLATNVSGVKANGRLMVFDPVQNALLLFGGVEPVPQPYLFFFRYAGGSGSTSPPPPTASDTTAPTVSMSGPAVGATVFGTVTVSANASDNVGVVGVQFKLDGVNLGAEKTTAPFTASWTTTSTSNGSHTLAAVARDLAGNVGTSSSVTVNVNNPVADTQAPLMPANLTVTPASSTQINLAWSATSDNVGVTGYRVYRGGGQIATVTGTSFQDTGLQPSTTYSYQIAAQDAAGNVSPLSAVVNGSTMAEAPTPPPPAPPAPDSGTVINASPSNYLTLLRSLRPGDTLVLAAGNYNGLPIFDVNGTAAQPIVITGPATGAWPVIVGSAGSNTVRLQSSSYVTISNLEVNSRNLGGDGVNGQTTSHHITLDSLYIHGCSDDHGTVGISTNRAAVWNWTIRNTVITDCGTGIYLGDSDGNEQFVAGVIENNVIYDTLGYNMEIKHQNPRPALAGMPTGASRTIIRNNVFGKANRGATGGLARPNLLVGHFPLSGPGMNDVYEIYGNFFYQNPTESLFQGEGNIALYNNLFFTTAGDAVAIMPHHDVPRTVRVFNNTVVASGTGIRVSGGSTAFTQTVFGNAVFAGTPLSGGSQRDNTTGAFAAASTHLVNPVATLGALDLYPKAGMLRGTAIDMSSVQSFDDWDRDFNGDLHDGTYRGAYSGSGTNPGWLPRLEIKPPASGSGGGTGDGGTTDRTAPSAPGGLTIR